MTKKGSILFLTALVFFTITFLFPVTAFAAKNSVPVVFVSESVNIDERIENDNRENKLFFLFCSAISNKKHMGDVYVAFEDLTIEEEWDGNIYVFFGRIILGENADIKGKIYTFSSVVQNDSKNFIFDSISPILPFASSFFGKNTDILYNDTIPLIAIMLILGIIKGAFCAVLYGIKKSFMEQGSVLLLYKPLQVINTGIGGYLAFAALIFILILSVLLIPFALFALIAFYVLNMIGQTALAIIVGHFVLDSFKKRGTPQTNLLIGLLIIEGVKLIPIFSILLTYLFLPILSLGTVIAAFINGYVTKTFYDLPYASEDEKKPFARMQIRDMIIRNNY